MSRALVAAALALLAGAALGQPFCPPGHGPFTRSQPTPDGVYRICLTDVTAGKYELFAVGANNLPVRLSPEMDADRDVILFQIAPDSSLVAFTCDRTTWTKYDLYTAPVTGGVPVRINKPLPVEHDVDDFLWSGSRIVWRQGRNTTGLWALYSADRTGGLVVTLSQPMATGGAVQRGFQILSGDWVRYSANPDGGGVFKWYAVSASGGRIMEELFRDGFESGNAGGWR